MHIFQNINTDLPIPATDTINRSIEHLSHTISKAIDKETPKRRMKGDHLLRILTLLFNNVTIFFVTSTKDPLLM